MSLSEKLIAAAKSGNTKEVRKLLGKGALFTKDQFGNTALHEAAWNGNNDIVKILLTGFCFVDSINNTGFTPLHLASQNGHAKVVKTLLKWKANSTLLNQHGETALHLVAKYDHSNVISSFAAHKISLDLRGKDGNTALHIAAKLGNIETVKAMLSAGAHPAVPNDRYMRPVDYAEAGEYQDVAKALHSAMQKHKPKHHSTSSIPPQPSPLSSPSSPYYSLSQPEETSLSQPVGDIPVPAIRAIKPRTQRAMSASVKLRPSRESSKHKSKKNSKEEREQKLTGSLSPTPHKYFSSQDDLDSSGMCPSSHKDRPFRSISPSVHRQQATIDQLLSEIETEYLGPDYKYIPPQDPQKHTEGHSHPLSVSTKDSPKSAKSFLQSTRNGISSKSPYDILAPGSDEEYDYLPPTNSNANSNNSPPHPSRAINEHAQNPNVARSLPPTPETPVRSDKFKNHTYEPLLPKEDGDTYVYMAPLSDYPELVQEENGKTKAGSRSPDSHSLLSDSGSDLSNGGAKNGKKVTAIRDSPVEADRKHEPNPVMEPVKGILMTQTSGIETDKSQLEDYLQKELETIRQAFQIRLNQLEKRYQHQLEIERKKNVLSPLVSRRNLQNSSPQCKGMNKQRRNSWHSFAPFDLEDDFEIPEKKSSSVVNGGGPSNSPGGPDIYERDPSPVHVNELPESLRGGNQPVPASEGSGKQDDPQAIDSDYEDMSGGLDKDSQELIQQKVKEYRERMLQHFKEQSEARIAMIEHEYQSQMSEVQRKCEDNATEKIAQLQSRMNGLEVQTLV